MGRDFRQQIGKLPDPRVLSSWLSNCAGHRDPASGFFDSWPGSRACQWDLAAGFDRIVSASWRRPIRVWGDIFRDHRRGIRSRAKMQALARRALPLPTPTIITTRGAILWRRVKLLSSGASTASCPSRHGPRRIWRGVQTFRFEFSSAMCHRCRSNGGRAGRCKDGISECGLNCGPAAAAE